MISYGIEENRGEKGSARKIRTRGTRVAYFLETIMINPFQPGSPSACGIRGREVRYCLERQLNNKKNTRALRHVIYSLPQPQYPVAVALCLSCRFDLAAQLGRKTYAVQTTPPHKKRCFTFQHNKISTASPSSFIACVGRTSRLTVQTRGTSPTSPNKVQIMGRGLSLIHI